jgi:hypothetical protein
MSATDAARSWNLSEAAARLRADALISVEADFPGILGLNWLRVAGQVWK